MKEFQIKRNRHDSTDSTDQRPALVRVDDRGRITWTDATTEQLFGYDSTALHGLEIRRLVATRQDDPMSPHHAEPLGRGESLTLTFRHHDGFFFTGTLGLRFNQQDADRASAARIESRTDTPLDPRVLQMLEQDASLGVWELDVASNRITWSDGLYRILDLRAGQDLDPEHALFYFQESQNRVRAALRRCMQRGRSFEMTLPVLTARQRRRWVRLCGRALRQGERIQWVTGMVRDITADREREAATHHWHQLLQGLLAATDDLVVAVDTDLRIIFLNNAYRKQFQATFGMDPQVGDDLISLLEEFPNERRLYQRLWERAFEREGFCVEMPLAQQDRELPVYEINYHRLGDSTGSVIGAALVARNMAARLRVTDNLNYLSSHDPMTGLLNRREFLQRLRRAIRVGADKGTVHSLLYLDLDHFAALNEAHGPSACDRYLRELANLLTSRVRQRDALARVGGDKFAILLDNCGDAESRNVADNVVEMVRGFRFEWHDHTLETSLSGGMVPIVRASESDAEDTLALAADLCRTAKNAGRDRIHIHRDQSIAVEESRARELVHRIQQSIRDDAIELRFQSIRPIASATWGDYIEIFSRLKTGPEEGDEVWEPADFLPLAERFDLANQLDRAVIRKTLDWLAQHPLLEPRLKLCSFNLSLASVQDTELADSLAPLLEASPFAADRFCFEIRETDAARHPDAVASCCEALHRLGCRVALDSTGGAGQSYALMAQLPLDVIKLDGRLMKSVREDPVQKIMIEALHKMAEVSGRITIAQFVEDDEALREIRQLGIHFAQGYRLSPPRPLEELAPVAVPQVPGADRNKSL